MLMRDPDTDSASPEPPVRICTICDGLDAVLRMAGYVAHIGQTAARTDLSLAEALDVLNRPDVGDFDQIVVAPDTTKEASPRLVAAILDAAMPRCGRLVVLLPPKVRFDLPDRPGLHLLHGPPFFEFARRETAAPPAPEHEARVPVPPPSRGLRSLFAGRWSDRGRSDAPVPPPATAAPARAVRPRRVLGVQPMSGGVGATTLACAMAAEFARLRPERRVCLMDLNQQFGNVATYFDLKPDQRISDAYRIVGRMDAETFQTCLSPVDDRLGIFSAPAEILPLDCISAADVRKLIALAGEVADLVILDLPHLIADWGEGVFAGADLILGVCALDVRSAQNAAKLRDLMRTESLAQTEMSWLLNRAPVRRGKVWRETLAGMEKGLGQAFDAILPEGGVEVATAGNAGIPLWKHAGGNPLRHAVRAYCEDLLPTLGAARVPSV